VKQTIWRELKPFLFPIIVLMVYAIVRVVFTSMSGGRGVLEPNGSPDAALAVLAFATFVLRCAALVIVPAFVVYKLCMRVAKSVVR
jgi:hypothetical protein